MDVDKGREQGYGSFMCDSQPALRMPAVGEFEPFKLQPIFVQAKLEAP